MTPSFAMPGTAIGGTPKASSSTSGHGLSLLPPPAIGSGSGQVTNEVDDLREKLRLAEERAQHHYDEMKEYQSWLQQVEEGQGTLKGTNDIALDPVPDNPPGLWDKQDGKDGSIINSEQGQDGKDWRRPLLSHGRNVRTLMYGDQMSFKPFVSRLEILTRLLGGDGLHLLNYRILITLCYLTQVTFDSNPLAPNCLVPCRTWLMQRAKWHLK